MGQVSGRAEAGQGKTEPGFRDFAEAFRGGPSGALKSTVRKRPFRENLFTIW